MNIAALSFDTDETLAGLRRWIECESPTFDTPAVNRMMSLAAEDLATAGADIRRIPGQLGLGDCLLADFPRA